MKVENVSVKVMRSHDYCHFEVCFSAIVESLYQANELRREAARLADKAVEEYKLAKENAQLCEYDKRKLEILLEDARRIEKKAEADRTPTEKARLKAIQDLTFKRQRYDYQDDWKEEEEWEPVIPEDDDAQF